MFSGKKNNTWYHGYRGKRGRISCYSDVTNGYMICFRNQVVHSDLTLDALSSGKKNKILQCFLLQGVDQNIYYQSGTSYQNLLYCRPIPFYKPIKMEQKSNFFCAQNKIITTEIAL